jgi:hypothetical protein
MKRTGSRFIAFDFADRCWKQNEPDPWTGLNLIVYYTCRDSARAYDRASDT